MKYNGNKTIDTAYKIAPTKIKARLFKKVPRPLKIIATPSVIMCGMTKAVAMRAPACSEPVVVVLEPIKLAIRKMK